MRAPCLAAGTPTMAASDRWMDVAGAEAPGTQEGLAGWPGTWLSLLASRTGESGREG